jgi:hypothetical protein
MYFSKHNKDVVYINHYSGLLEVEGNGPLLREDSEVRPESENWQEDYNVLSVTEGITSLEEGYLESFPNIDCLILSRSVISVHVSEELEMRFRKRRVLIRGEYETFAEEFATEKKLKFLHCDIPLATDVDEVHKERDIITLRFHVKGAPDIHHNVFTPGSSAGSYGGGEYASELPRNFYAGLTVEGFADRFPERLREQLTGNAMLRRFLEAANRRVSKK